MAITHAQICAPGIRIGLVCAFFIYAAIAWPPYAQPIDVARERPAMSQQSASIAKRVATLRRSSDALRKAAASPLLGDMSATDRTEAQRYVRWLQSKADQMDELAAKGESALHGETSTDAQLSFNLQYLQLQNEMAEGNRSYTAISNIMKTKHDTVKNSISNVR